MRNIDKSTSSLNKLIQMLEIEEPTSKEIDEIEELLNQNEATRKLSLIHVTGDPKDIQDVIDGKITTITTTTSEYNYDMINEQFCQTAKEIMVVLAVHIGRDYLEYQAEKSKNGGKYGFDYWYIEYIIHSQQEWDEMCKENAFLQDIDEF